MHTLCCCCCCCCCNNTEYIITHPSPIEFANILNRIIADVNEWFKNNLLSINLDKTTYLQFWTKNSQKLDLNITLLNNQIINSTNTKFLGLTIEEMLSWKCHINQILSRLSSACYAIKVITPLTSEDTFKLIYHSHVHSVITYGIIFWGNSPHNNDIFKIQKRIIRIMTKSRSRDSCRRFFQRLEILPLHSQYIFSALLLVI